MVAGAVSSLRSGEHQLSLKKYLLADVAAAMGKVRDLENKTDSRSADELIGSTRTGNLFVFTGPSGVGKGTIREQLLQQVPGIVMSVSVTTRERRPGEQEGVHYFFRSVEEFSEMRAANELMEWAEFAGCFYGTPNKWVENQLRAGLDVLLEIEVQGAKQIRQRFPSAVLIFVSPPSLEALRQRLVGRGTESSEKIAMRLAKAQGELREKYLFHYEVVNDNIEEAVQNLAHIVYAERCRIHSSSSGEPNK
jgi:guanylate kinase